MTTIPRPHAVEQILLCARQAPTRPVELVLFDLAVAVAHGVIRLEWREGGSLASAGRDVIWLERKQVERMNARDLGVLLAHEMCHLALGHGEPGSGEGVPPHLRNDVWDLAINFALGVDALELPCGGVGVMVSPGTDYGRRVYEAAAVAGCEDAVWKLTEEAKQYILDLAARDGAGQEGQAGAA